MAKGTHDYVDDPRNSDILININGELFARDQAKVSVFDSGYILGDGVWEGLRVHNGKIAFLDAHLVRLYEGAKTIDMPMDVSMSAMAERLYATLDANHMRDGVHIRLMVTRGIKATPYQDPRVTIGQPTVVIIPEFKTALPDTLNRGIKLFTAHVRRGYSDVQDPKLNSHSKLNCIMACIQAAKAGYDEALMLDPHGFVATCNSTHFFIVRNGAVWTSTGDYCLGGITRGQIIRLCHENQIECQQRNFSLTDVYTAEEAFVTGTFAGVVPVSNIDGRDICPLQAAPAAEASLPGPVTAKLQALYMALLERECGS